MPTQATFQVPATLEGRAFFDRHGGFTIESGDRGGSRYSLWRPGIALGNHEPDAVLISSEPSFYQRNDNVILACYKVKGYRYLILAWFDPATGERIA